MIPWRFAAASVACFVAVCIGTGCATYVNIPPQPGDVARHDPNDLSIVQAMGEALNAAVVDQPIQGRYAIVLPEGVSADSYKVVAARLGEAAVWPGDVERPDIPLVEVKEVRIRGLSAQVDIVRPTSPTVGAPGQVVTVYLQQNPVTGWHVEQVRIWRANVQDVLTPTP